MARTNEQQVERLLRARKGGKDFHRCGTCGASLPCPDAWKNLSPCTCEHASLALVENEGRALGADETGTSEMFFCNPETCTQKWIDKYFVCESDDDDDDDNE